MADCARRGRGSWPARLKEEPTTGRMAKRRQIVVVDETCPLFGLIVGLAGDPTRRRTLVTSSVSPASILPSLIFSLVVGAKGGVDEIKYRIVVDKGLSAF